ncbi:Six-hairpin glycosidase-like protein [Pleurostoma richardsiae]|uniref:Six-hairpin glycosidase-like protein n=1 Tax=Pleurostoma richardsiae TaxID=41990 RepID=A0AA38RVQ2_9PEZI|nr:Six-hairpin glycosidase-like protein [Pleurostoma richardsiae]
MKALILKAAGALVAATAAAAADVQPLVPLAFEPLNLGEIKPQGWLHDQLVLQANGLGGHLMDFWKFVSQSAWIGGTSEYSLLHEAFPYWLNAIVPLAYGVNDSRLKAQVRNATDWVLDHQQADGWLGYEVGTNRNMWPRNLLCLGLMQLAQADPDYTDRIVTAMQRFAVLANSMLADNYTGFIYHDGDLYSEGGTEWGISRAQDLMIPFQWLFDYYPGNNSQILLENMKYLYDAGVNWDYWFRPDVFPRGEWEQLNREDEAFWSSLPWEYQHGVNEGEGLKATAVYYRFLHNESLVPLTHQGVNWTFFYHGSASGSILADEYINGLAGYMGSETCTAVEVMYSLSYLYQALGENWYADRAELAAYNALPVAVTPDWWARQYMAEPNQPWSKNLTSTPFSDVNTVGQMYTLEGNYPCCTVNHPQGYPKFLAASYVYAGESGLAHALLAPANVSTTLKNGAKVTVVTNTNYPFDLNILYNITTDAPFDFYVRVPEWADVSQTTTAVANGSASSVDPDAATGMHKIAITDAGTTEVAYKLSTSIRVEPRINSTVAVHYGALLYGLSISSINSSTIPWDYQTNAPMKEGYAPAEARDWTITNTSAWNYAIDPSTLQYHYCGQAAPGRELANPIWAPGAPPNVITAKACLIDWPLYLDSIPGRVPLPEERRCIGPVEQVELRPYGSTKLHMTDLPVLDLSDTVVQRDGEVAL